MNIFTRKLSASTGWKRINVVETATAWDLIHTWPTEDNEVHKIYLFADNTKDTAVVLSIEFWDAVKPIDVSLAANSWPTLVVPWLVLEDASTAYTVKAFADTTEVVNISWYVEAEVA